MEWSYVLWFCVAYWVGNRIEKAFCEQNRRIQKLEMKVGTSDVERNY